MATRYVVRDVRTYGCDYLAWGDDDEVGARTALAEVQALLGEDEMELDPLKKTCLARISCSLSKSRWGF